MRTWTVQEDRPNGLPPISHTFKGFNKEIVGADHIVIIEFSGEMEIFAVESGQEFQRYLDYRDEKVKIIGWYDRR